MKKSLYPITLILTITLVLIIQCSSGEQANPTSEPTAMQSANSCDHMQHSSGEANTGNQPTTNTELSAKLDDLTSIDWLDHQTHSFQITLTIPDGSHAFLPGGTSSLGLPIEVKLVSKEFELMNLVFPKGEEKKDENGNTLYELNHQGIIQGELRLLDEISTLPTTLQMIVRVQLCSGDVCYPPKSLKINVNL